MTTTLTRRAGVVVLALVTTAALAACGGIGARLTFTDTEKAKVTEIAMQGGSGDVTVHTAAVTETTIKRVVQHSSDPGPSYRMDGTVLLIDTSCGPDCTVSYDIQAPAGVTVTGGVTSGDVRLTDVKSADVTLTSGDIMINGATAGVKAISRSGDMTVAGGKGPVTLQAGSGDVRAVDLAGPVNARTNSGNVDVTLTTPASVTAQASSGDVRITVPAGAYQVRTDTGSGDASVGIADDPSATNVLDVRTRSGDVTISAA
jgi:Putative adhesin